MDVPSSSSSCLCRTRCHSNMHACMADMGGGAVAPTPTPLTHYPATASSSPVAPAVAPTPAPSTHCATTASLSPAADEEVEHEGAALAAVVGASTTSTYLASSSRQQRMWPPATSSDVAWTVEDAAIGDELRPGSG
uniref:Uncharacterized protein n=1 Tax=Oryza rufipogon TaxID=4529 RepID=A0A0E0PCB5_ORYRU